MTKLPPDEDIEISVRSYYDGSMRIYASYKSDKREYPVVEPSYEFYPGDSFLKRLGLGGKTHEEKIKDMTCLAIKRLKEEYKIRGDREEERQKVETCASSLVEKCRSKEKTRNDNDR